MTALFLFGTLRHGPLREIVLGEALEARPARLAGYAVRVAARGHWPVLVEAPGAVAEGMLVEPGPAAQKRADFFELGFGYELRPVVVETDTGSVAAQAYFGPAEADAQAWDLADWTHRWAPTWELAGREAMACFGRITAAELARRWPMIELRAASALRAASPHPAEVRAGFDSSADVDIFAKRTPYMNFFRLTEIDMRFRRFDGAMSDPVTRAGFIGGDAATVLPWDPVADTVLLVEQFRTGPLLRGDPRPWTLEPIAGRVDPGEGPEDCVRREAREEAGLALGRLHKVAEYYPSPGAVTEYVFSYVAEADLAGRDGAVGGVDHEDENIRAHVIPFERLMDLVASGEAANGPLVLTALWLQRHREG